VATGLAYAARHFVVVRCREIEVHSSSKGRGPRHPQGYSGLITYSTRCNDGRGRVRTPLSPRPSRGRPRSSLALSNRRCRRGGARRGRGDPDPQWMGARVALDSCRPQCFSVSVGRVPGCATTCGAISFSLAHVVSHTCNSFTSVIHYFYKRNY
jgi:hypothetical protein